MGFLEFDPPNAPTHFSGFRHGHSGSDRSWASPEDQDTFFSDFSVAITQKL